MLNRIRFIYRPKFLFIMEIQEKITGRLKELTRHKHAKILNSGNSAILASLCIASRISKRKIVLIPDQGGWISFRKYPKKFGLEAVEVKTDRGLIDLEDLEKKTKDKDAAAFIVTSFAGYFAEQPMPEISKICRKNRCLLIEDATGAIGMSDDSLCNGKYSDIIVGSFGRWKPVNLGTGGFISTDKKEYFEKTEDIYPGLEFDGDAEKLLEKLEDAEKRTLFFLEKSKKIRKDLKKEGFDVFHAEKRGLNAVVGFKNDAEKQKLIDYCSKNGYEFVLCPKDIRVDENAVSIEVKRLEMQSSNGP
ncbi:hypothetical protein COV19_00225 [Candidatus Woesearchaeota archaeon CG10_big_fil_rev_8_21_14_0_10_44_13]|nr:MAG: hypothetical protein COV19_00225 [Candidatus Woesearchaeota archaeon CG10_big_fil_rev_8_21_14_0_10_44_13]